ncbi:MAG: hypothetical protein GEV28_04020 [Actinophytocola sp.]|uniref:UGSC family (seleno)protein n=1 Tax=Actinophytocola sp. TaxID=1872138 RepID=UPI001321B137|nr:hypothetical protein [Actinophytocola sp.]MPZ79596.1 hypothetical protein [Actinophytocola sp.]
MIVEFLDPRSPAAPAQHALAALPRSLGGVTLGLVDNSKANAGFLLDRVGEALAETMNVTLLRFGKRVPSDALTAAQLEEITTRCDLVLTAMGD